MNDTINRLARATKTPIRVRAIMQEGGSVTVYAAGTINDNTRAFLSRFFCGLPVYVTEA